MRVGTHTGGWRSVRGLGVSCLALAAAMSTAAWAVWDAGALGGIAIFTAGLLAAHSIHMLSSPKPAKTANSNLDISELKNRVRALDEHSIVSITDAEARIIDVNQRFLDTFEYTMEELIGHTTDLIYPDDDKTQFTDIRDTLARGDTWLGEVRLQKKSGGIVWTQTTIFPLFADDGTHVSNISVRTDITEIKKAQSEQDMRSALHMLRDEVYVFDAETLHFTYLNQAAMARFGWSEDVYRTKTPRDTNPGFDVQRFMKRAERLRSGEMQQLGYVVELGDRSVEIALQYVINRDGRAQFVAFANDVSERLELQKAKDEFIATVSHELRSPLTSIKGGLGLVLSGATGDLSEKSRSLLEIAHRNSDRLVHIVNDFLDLEKIASGEMAFNVVETDLSALLWDAATANEAFCAQYMVKIRAEGIDTPQYGSCDPDRMFQVLNNLLSNAAKFSEPGSEIILKLDKDPDGSIISVRDFGAGIPLDAQEKIFDRFAQVKGSNRKIQGGTGLGLAIVRSIVEKHGGTVTLESALGEGATFTVRLPDRPALTKTPDAAISLDVAG